ncbi:MAG: hypothetical protein WAN35_13810 [Terracidiphilus sp.]|jgi:hypothetical protein
MTTEVQTATKQASSTTAKGDPVIIDLGKQKRKKIRQLRKGRGPLFAKVSDTQVGLRAKGVTDDNSGPTIVLVKEKKRRRKFGFGGPLW